MPPALAKPAHESVSKSTIIFVDDWVLPFLSGLSDLPLSSGVTPNTATSLLHMCFSIPRHCQRGGFAASFGLPATSALGCPLQGDSDLAHLPRSLTCIHKPTWTGSFALLDSTLNSFLPQTICSCGSLTCRVFTRSAHPNPLWPWPFIIVVNEVGLNPHLLPSLNLQGPG